MESIGVPKDWCIVDVYGLDNDLLAIVPQPVLAVILLFPITDNLEKLKKEQEEQEEEGEKAQKNENDSIKDIIFVKQLVSNSCGAMAVIHSIANNLDRISLLDGPLKKFIETVKGLSPVEAGEILQSSDIGEVHDDIAEEGQTEAPDPNVNVNFHYATFVEHNGALVELDGRKSSPIIHSSTSRETLLQDTVKVIRSFMERDPENIHFTMMALVPAFS
ncbi:hypothetical protein PGB90_006667 [Kerria lacca]